MLKSRIITAAILAPIFLGLLWWLPTGGAAALFGLITLLGGWEWARLIGLQQPAVRGAFLAGLLGLMVAGWVYYRLGLSPVPVFVLAGVWWLAALNWLQRYSRHPEMERPAAALGMVVGYLVLALSWFALVYLRGIGDASETDSGRYMIFLLLFVVWAADIGAYFAGRAFGRRKLAVQISPGKTWEGAAGGLVLAVIVGALMHLFLGPGWPPLYVQIPLVIVTVMFSIVGDLFESMVKRQGGAKDSGTILPGHGGVLDRVDSLTAAAPIFVMGLLWWRMTP